MTECLALATNCPAAGNLHMERKRERKRESVDISQQAWDLIRTSVRNDPSMLVISPHHSDQVSKGQKSLQTLCDGPERYLKRWKTLEGM